MSDVLKRVTQIYTVLKRSPLFWPVAAFIGTIIAVILLLSGGIISINTQESVASTSQITAVDFTNKYGQIEQLNVEVADNPQAWEQGLMLRSSMSANNGMLFVFDVIEGRTFWMKDTLIPLDIIFFDQDLKVVNLYSNTKPDQTSELYPSQTPIKYALETNAGWATTVGLQKGDQIILK